MLCQFKIRLPKIVLECMSSKLLLKSQCEYCLWEDYPLKPLTPIRHQRPFSRELAVLFKINLVLLLLCKNGQFAQSVQFLVFGGCFAYFFVIFRSYSSVVQGCCQGLKTKWKQQLLVHKYEHKHQYRTVGSRCFSGNSLP